MNKDYMKKFHINQLSLKIIDELFIVEDSELYWKSKKGEKLRLAGSSTKGGYLRFEHYGKTYANHNILWCYYNRQQIPDGYCVDHIDNNPLNNLEGNLRLCDKYQNGYNSKLYKNNSSGVKGVCWDKETCKWMAQARFGGKNYKLGRYLTIKEAEEALIKFREDNHKGFANHG